MGDMMRLRASSGLSPSDAERRIATASPWRTLPSEHGLLDREVAQVRFDRQIRVHAFGLDGDPEGPSHSFALVAAPRRSRRSLVLSSSSVVDLTAGV